MKGQKIWQLSNLAIFILVGALAFPRELAGRWLSNQAWLSLLGSTARHGIRDIRCNSSSATPLATKEIWLTREGFEAALGVDGANASAVNGWVVTTLFTGRVETSLDLLSSSERALLARDGLGAWLYGCAFWQAGQEQRGVEIMRQGGEPLALFLSDMVYTLPAEQQSQQAFLLDRSAAIAPASLRVIGNYGAWLVGKNQLWPAVQLYQRLYLADLEAGKPLSADQMQAAYEAAVVLIKMGDYSQAVDLLSKIIALDNAPDASHLAWMYHQRARAAYPLGLKEQALADIAYASQLDPADGEHELAWGQFLIRQGEEANALAHFEHVIAASTDKNAALLNVGKRLIWEGKFALAAGYLQQVETGDTLSLEALGWQGYALGKDGQARAAEAALVPAVNGMNPVPLEWLQSLGEMYAHQGRDAEAEEIYLRLLALDPENSAAKEFLHKK